MSVTLMRLHLNSYTKAAEGMITHIVPGELTFTPSEGAAREFAYQRPRAAWVELQEDPFQNGVRTFSQNGPSYFFVPAD